MLRTFTAPFDFHDPDGGRKQFRELVEKCLPRFAAEPQIIDVPLFSYERTGRDQLNAIAGLDVARPAIVYLSDIVMHSSLMIMGECDANDLHSPLRYESLASFIASPLVQGFYVARDTTLAPKFDSTTIVVSDLAAFYDELDSLQNDGLFRIIHESADGFVCNVLDYPRYFSQCKTQGDHPFFIDANAAIDAKDCLKKMANGTLRQFLIDEAVAFATLGDDHMDDEYAVSYRFDCWNATGDRLAFAR